MAEFDYAQRLMKQIGGDWYKFVPALSDYDEAAAAQAASLLQASGVSVRDPAIMGTATKAGTQVARGFQAFAEA